MTTAAELSAPKSSPTPKRNPGFNLEKWGWVYMRVSGVLLVVLIFGHLFANLIAPPHGVHDITFAFVTGKLTQPFWQWWDVAMLWLAFIHGANGMRTITNDYVRNETARKALVWTIGISVSIMIVLGTLVVFTFDPCAGVLGDFEKVDSVLYPVCQATR